MRVLMAEFKIKQDSVQEFNAARDKVLAELSEAHPEGVRYIWCAMPDGNSFFGWLELEEGVENPLPNTEAGREFLKNVLGWVDAAPVRQELRVIGAYLPLAIHFRQG